MKIFVVKFESIDWCGYWDYYVVYANDNETIETLSKKPILEEYANEWLYENVDTQLDLTEEELENMDADELAQMEDDAIGSVSIEVADFDEETDSVNDYEVIDLTN